MEDKAWGFLATGKEKALKASGEVWLLDRVPAELGGTVPDASNKTKVVAAT